MRREILGSKPALDVASFAGPDAATYTAGQRAVIDYIRTMTEELSTMADGARLPLLAYLLDMARLEAEGILTREAGGRPRARVSSKRAPL